MAVLFLSAGVEPYPGPTTKHENLANKIDTLAADLKALNQETIDRLTTLANDITTRVSTCESSFSILEVNVAKLHSDHNDNVANTMKMAIDLAAITFAQANFSVT